MSSRNQQRWSTTKRPLTNLGLKEVKPVFTNASKELTSSGLLGVDQGGTNSKEASVVSFNNISGFGATGATGAVTSELVFSKSPVLETPDVGVAKATSLTIGTGIYWAAVVDLLDEETVTLPVVSANYSGHGLMRFSVAGVIVDSAEFEVGSDGNVSLIRATPNVVVGAACANLKICISTAGAQNPVIIKARNGAGKMAVEFWYK